MGEETAQSMGVDVARLRIEILICVSLLAAHCGGLCRHCRICRSGWPAYRADVGWRGSAVLFAAVGIGWGIGNVTNVDPVQIYHSGHHLPYRYYHCVNRGAGVHITDHFHPPGEAEMSLTLQNIDLSYGRNQVLFDVSINTVNRGEFVGLIGPNASGKSTLFRAITGLVKPSGGRVMLGDTDLAKLRRSERARRVAYMPQAYGCNAALSVFESVLLALKQTTGWRVKAANLSRVEEVLSELSLSHIADRSIGALSGGQAQMVAVAQTLVRDPSLVLLDEPTSALDLHHQLSILSSIRKAIHTRDMIGIAALHDLNLAAQFCDRLILIREGRVIADGPPKDVLSLDEIGQTYNVTTHLNHTERGSLFVEARL